MPIDDIDDKYNEAAIERRMKQIKLNRKASSFKKGLRQLYSFIRFCLLLFLIYATYRVMTCHWWYLPSSFLKTDDSSRIKIAGNVITSNYRILSALKHVDIQNKPIYLIKTKDFSDSILALDPIKRVYIRRFGFPARIVIQVEEKVPIISISPAETVAPIAFFTSDGTLIGQNYLPLDKSIKTYLVLSYGTKGDDYKNWDIKKVNSIYRLAVALETFSEEKIEFMDFRDPKDIYIKLESVLIRLGELDSNSINRVQDIKILIEKMKGLENTNVKYIDLRWESNYLKLDKKVKKEPQSTQQANVNLAPQTTETVTNTNINKTEKMKSNEIKKQN